MTEKQRVYIEALTKQLGIGRSWADGVRSVLGEVPWSRYNSESASKRNHRRVNHVIDTLQWRATRQRQLQEREGAKQRARIPTTISPRTSDTSGV